jgi:hypothetical protein
MPAQTPGIGYVADSEVSLLRKIVNNTAITAGGGGGGSGTPGGANGDLQVNSAGAFGGIAPGAETEVLTVVGGAWASAPATGGSGTSVTFGIDSPSGGSDGDVYIETDTGEVWQNNSGTWAVQTEFVLVPDLGTIAFLPAPEVANLAATTAVPSTAAPFRYWYYKELSGNITLTDAAAGVEGSGYVLTLIGDGTARVVTFPSSYSEETGSNRTTFTLAVNQQVTITRKFVNGSWRIYGDPASGVPAGVILKGGSATPIVNGTVAAQSVINGGAQTIPGNMGSVAMTLVGTMTNGGAARGLTLTIRHAGNDIIADSSSSTVIPNVGGERVCNITVTLFNISTSLSWLTASISIGPPTNAPSGFGDLAASGPLGGTLAGSSTVDTSADATLDVRLSFTGSDDAALTWTTRAWELTRR